MSINTRSYIEKFIKIRDKESRIIPLKLNKPQIKLYNVIKKQKEQRKPVRIIILKARQMGFSTMVEAILNKETTTKFNVNTGIIAHKEDATSNLFEMSKLMYDCLPEGIKPAIKKNNALELVFDNDLGTGLHSKIRCFTAGSKGAARSYSFNNLHLSELAFWPGDVKKTLLGLLQTVPYSPNSMIIIESTPNGFEQFYKMWKEAKKGDNDYYPLFIGWNELEEYKMPYTGFELTPEEYMLQDTYKLSLEQLTWRRWCIKNNCDNDIEQFHQEYPICPEEAFIASGLCYFNKEIIIGRINKLTNEKRNVIKGQFVYNYENNEIKDIIFIEDKKGYIEIFQKPEIGHPYVIGGDTAGEGSDYFTGQAIDNSSGKQVARLRAQLDEDEYSRQMFCLGMYYNTALLSIEINFSTYPVKKLVEYKYPKLFLRQKEDKPYDDYENKYGFKTTKVTRPIILAILKEIFRDEIDLINDIDTLDEALVFIKNEKNRPEAQQGEHDDLIMALAIAYYSRNQQEFTVIDKSKEKENVLPFALQDEEVYTDDIIGW